ncbi:CG2199, partial [Drosophila busckii]
FQCKLCDKCFTQASSLSVHMKIHAGEKPFPCHICGKAYSQQAYLNKHIQAHAMDASTAP